MKVIEIVKITRGKLLSGDPASEIDPAKISTDSRAIKKGEFFIALKGSNFDGNDFVDDVLRRGAAGAIVSSVKVSKCHEAGKIIIQVLDTTKALQEIAAHHRKQFNIPVVCITGSNGKTTVKDMAWHLLSTHYNVLRNEGTKNNHIGVPQTLLKSRAEIPQKFSSRNAAEHKTREEERTNEERNGRVSCGFAANHGRNSSRCNR